MEIRFVVPDDSRALLDVYAQYVDTPVTFECALPSEHEFSERIAAVSAWDPWLVSGEGGQLAGYACAHRYMEREAYQWGAELSVYLDRNHTSRGLGKRLYRMLMEILIRQGVRTAYARVTLPNAGSRALHESLGFREVGICRNAGYKRGTWHDVMWYEKQLAPYDENPAPLKSVRELPQECLLEMISQEMR